MSSLNKVLLIGHLGAKPEMRKTNSGDSIARLRVATNRYWKQDDRDHKETEWHDVTAFGKLAETCEAWLDKGRQVFVEGRVKSSTWEDQHGTKRLSREVVAQRINFLDSRADGGDLAA